MDTADFTVNTEADVVLSPFRIFKFIFLNENVWISFKILLKFVLTVRINNISALVQIMAWRRPGDKPLSKPMMISLPTHVCVTRPRWSQWLPAQASQWISQIWKVAHCLGWLGRGHRTYTYDISQIHRKNICFRSWIGKLIIFRYLGLTAGKKLSWGVVNDFVVWCVFTLALHLEDWRMYPNKWLSA